MRPSRGSASSPLRAPQLEVVRLGLGLALLGGLVALTPDLQDLHGSGSLVTADAATEMAGTPLRLPLLSALAPEALLACHAFFLLVVVAWTLGWHTAITSWLVWFGFLAYWQSNPVVLYGPDRLAAAFLPVLCCAPLDRWLSIRKRPAPAATAEPSRELRARACLWILRLQMTVIFFWTAAHKLAGPLWWSGEAAWVALLNVGLAPQAGGLHLWLAGHFWAINLATYATVALELAYPFLIWTRLRPWVLAAAILFHLATAVVLGLWLFASTAIAAHLVFIPRPWLTR